MAKVKRVKANKDYPEHGIKKGDLYYKWSLRTGPYSSQSFKSITPPKPEQLTTSAFLISVYEIQGMIDNFNPTMESFDDDLREIKDALGALIDEQDEKFNNLPDTPCDSCNSLGSEYCALGCSVGKL